MGDGGQARGRHGGRMQSVVGTGVYVQGSMVRCTRRRAEGVLLHTKFLFRVEVRL